MNTSNDTSFNLIHLGMNVMSINGNVLETNETRIAVKAAQVLGHNKDTGIINVGFQCLWKGQFSIL